MASPTLLLNMNTGGSNADLLAVARSLALRLGASVIGTAARQPMRLDVSGTCYTSPELIEAERAELDAGIDAAEAEFRAAFSPACGGWDIEWRASVLFGPPAGYIVDQARHADLLLTASPNAHGDLTRVAADDLIMQCGRPVLVIPPGSAAVCADRVMLGWKDTREARRAALDALPLLKLAAAVKVVEIAEEDDMAAARHRVEDVACWLSGHGVVAEPLAVVSRQGDAGQLTSLAEMWSADLIVAGAYGHGRLREWVFGGVTRTLLHHVGCCSMLSH